MRFNITGTVLNKQHFDAREGMKATNVYQILCDRADEPGKDVIKIYSLKDYPEMSKQNLVIEVFLKAGQDLTSEVAAKK